MALHSTSTWCWWTEPAAPSIIHVFHEWTGRHERHSGHFTAIAPSESHNKPRQGLRETHTVSWSHVDAEWQIIQLAFSFENKKSINSR